MGLASCVDPSGVLRFLSRRPGLGGVDEFRLIRGRYVGRSNDRGWEILL